MRRWLKIQTARGFIAALVLFAVWPVDAANFGLGQCARRVLNLFSEVTSEPRLGSVSSREPIDPNVLPQNAPPELREAIFQMFDGGPNIWVDTKHVPEGEYFQRGFGGISKSRGADEAIETLTGQPLAKNGHVTKLGDNVGEVSWPVGDAHALIFSKPIAIRGRIQRNRLGPPRNAANTTEARLLKGTVVSPQITSMGIFYSEMRTPEIDVYYAPAMVMWGEAYIKIYETFANAGLRTNPNGRGAKFTAELVDLYKANVPQVPYILSSSDGGFHRFYNQHRAFFERLADILYRYRWQTKPPD